MSILHCSTEDSALKANFLRSMSLDLPNINDLKSSLGANRRRLLICACGPSVESNIEAIKNFNGDIMSAKGTKFLMNNGVKPTYSVHCHPSDHELKYVTPKVDTTYIISTQCTERVFQTYANNTVYTFNTISSRTFVPPADTVLHGGSNVAVNALWVALFLGYTDITIAGFDASWALTTHVDRNLAQPDTMKVTYGDKVYQTTARMLVMALEMYKIVHATIPGVHLVFATDQLFGPICADKAVREAVTDALTKVLESHGEHLPNSYK